MSKCFSFLKKISGQDEEEKKEYESFKTFLEKEKQKRHEKYTAQQQKLSEASSQNNPTERKGLHQSVS